jgi:hypothetical protein
LELYDWKNEFFTFERIIKTSPFDGFCNSAFKTSRVSLIEFFHFLFHMNNHFLREAFKQAAVKKILKSGKDVFLLRI